MPVLRLAANRHLWEKLTQEGISRDNARRRAAQFSALQTMLTDSAGREPRQALAARKSAAPGLRVAADR